MAPIVVVINHLMLRKSSKSEQKVGSEKKQLGYGRNDLCLLLSAPNLQ